MFRSSLDKAHPLPAYAADQRLQWHGNTLPAFLLGMHEEHLRKLAQDGEQLDVVYSFERL